MKSKYCTCIEFSLYTHTVFSGGGGKGIRTSIFKFFSGLRKLSLCIAALIFATFTICTVQPSIFSPDPI